MEDEQRTLTLVNDVIDTLQSVAVSPSHTPALYSAFLRAVVSSRTSTSGHSSPRSATANGCVALPPMNPHAHRHDLSGSPLEMGSDPGAGVFGDEHQHGDGALGLKMFPPHSATPGSDPPWDNIPATPALVHEDEETDLQNALSFQVPAQFTSVDDFGSMSMDNIFSGGFWANILIPGTFQCD
jgi:hypothetical protein